MALVRHPGLDDAGLFCGLKAGPAAHADLHIPAHRGSLGNERLSIVLRVVDAWGDVRIVWTRNPSAAIPKRRLSPPHSKATALLLPPELEFVQAAGPRIRGRGRGQDARGPFLSLRSGSFDRASVARVDVSSSGCAAIEAFCIRVPEVYSPGVVTLVTEMRRSGASP